MPRKFTYRFFKCFVAILFFSTMNYSGYAQDSSKALPVTSAWKAYREQVKRDPSKKMVDLSSIIPGLVFDLRYAGVNNFMHRRMYPRGTTSSFLRAPAAAALAVVQKELGEKGLGIKIFDAYRPYSVTVRFWELVKDERYVANPAKGSGHNRGIAVDLTLIDRATGKELNMGTGFDNFTDTAHHSFSQLEENILQNRLLLKSTMENHGFRSLETEWWHYFLADGDRFEVLDIEFKKFRKKL